MIFRRTGRFRSAYAQLPKEIQEKAVKAFELFQENPRHPSLVIKRVKGVDQLTPLWWAFSEHAPCGQPCRSRTGRADQLLRIKILLRA